MKIVRSFVAELESRLGGALNFIQVVLGPRQVGKSTGLKQIADRWLGPVVMVTADEVAPPSTEWIDLHWKIARSKGPGTLLIIDEIQKVSGWSTTVKRLFDEDREACRLKVVLLGSASLSIQKGLAESLAGRYEIIDAPHWTYAECRDAFGWDLEKYVVFGGYPAAAELVEDPARWREFINRSIIEPVLFKDLLAIAPVSKPALFRQTFLLSLAYPAMEVSLQKMLGQLQDSGNVTTIRHYLDIFEGAFLIRTLQKFSGSAIRKRGSSPKILPMNTALVSAQRGIGIVHEDPEWFGRLFECVIGAELSRRFDALYYWRDGHDEVDYVVQDQGVLYGVEVKSGRTRRFGGLASFLRRFPEAVPVIIDQNSGRKLLEGAAWGAG